ncbi:hypothetical protein SAMD00079811_23500 [Scytonema sp. HK-05]|nr:hypothetical protein [Scytonema sp. HK-05]BAY44748.1 hypothetical protein SAMD00079811_23500 [Scytonema sp. HK-05]
MKKHTADLQESLGSGARGYREVARLFSGDSQFGSPATRESQKVSQNLAI